MAYITQTISQWSPGVGVPTSIAEVRAAKVQARSGNFSEASRVAYAMLGLNCIASAVSRCVEQILGSAFVLTPETSNGKPSATSSKLAQELGDKWRANVSDETLIAMLVSYLILGQAVATIDWDTRAGWKPTVRALSMEHVDWDEQDQCLYFTDANSKRLKITPGDGKWIAWGNHTSWQMSGLVALGEDYYGAIQTARDWLRYNERHGMPIMKLMVPLAAGKDDVAKFANDSRRMGSEGAIVCPTDLTDEGAKFDAELLEAKDGSWETFEYSLERIDRKAQIFFLGSNAGSELTGSAGSRAASEASNGAGSIIADGIARRFGTMLREQFVKPWVVWVYGGNPEDSPYPTWQVHKADGSEAHAAWTSLAAVCSSWALAGYEVANIVDLAAEMGLELKKAVITGDNQGNSGANSNSNSRGSANGKDNPGSASGARDGSKAS